MDKVITERGRSTKRTEYDPSCNKDGTSIKPRGPYFGFFNLSSTLSIFSPALNDDGDDDLDSTTPALFLFTAGYFAKAA